MAANTKGRHAASAKKQQSNNKANSGSRRQNSKKNGNKGRVGLILGGLVAVLLIAYVTFGAYFGNKFLPGTKAYGVSISGLSETSAKNKVEQKLSNKQFVLYDGNKKLASATATELGIKEDFANVIKKKLAAQNSWTFSKGQEEVEASKTPAFDEQKVNEFVKSLFPQINANRLVTKDASITQKNGKFAVVKEVNGTNFSEAEILALVAKNVAIGKSDIQLQSHYIKPKVTADSEKITQAMSKIEKISNIKITYQIAGQTVSVPNETLRSWLVYNNNAVSLNQALVQQYLASLNEQFATFGKTRTFKSTKRGTVSVPGATFGWSINISSEQSQLTAAVLKGQNVTREPVIQGSGYSKTGEDIGKTYVEVDKKNQHMWVYINGIEQISTDVVTGKPGQDTPIGVFYVWAKDKGSVLRGTNDDGTKYASPVDYWMPIDNTGVGIHDSPWQPKYGGDWWKEHGSHGCINTPPTVMAKLFSIVPTGTPVIVF